MIQTGEQAFHSPAVHEKKEILHVARRPRWLRKQCARGNDSMLLPLITGMFKRRVIPISAVEIEKDCQLRHGAWERLVLFFTSQNHQSWLTDSLFVAKQVRIMLVIHRMGEIDMNGENKNLVARDIMIPLKKLITLKPDMDALGAIRKLLKHRISGAPVLDDNRRYLGVFSEKTSMQFLLRLNYENLPSSVVNAFMNTDLDRTIDEELDLLSIFEMFLLTPYRRLPVLAGDVLVGQISRRDALKAATKSLDSPHSEGKQILYLSALKQGAEATA